jgi:NAD(P)-dependent dehydrogenase (short-subunit alcohol dehydrogenase family)
VSRYGRLDILLNNAENVGLSAVDDASLDELAVAVSIDQTGVFLGMKHAVSGRARQFLLTRRRPLAAHVRSARTDPRVQSARTGVRTYADRSHADGLLADRGGTDGSYSAH